MDRNREEALVKADIGHALCRIGVVLPEIEEIISYEGNSYRISSEGVVEIQVNQGWVPALLCVAFCDLPYALRVFINESIDCDEDNTRI